MDGSIAPTLVTAGASAVAIASLLWALRVTDTARGMVARFKERIGELELKLARADSIFGAHPGAVLIWEEGAETDGGVRDGDWGNPRAYGSPLALASLIRFSDSSMAADTAVRILQGLSSFEGRDATGKPARLSQSLMKLRREGAPFSLTISAPSGVFVEIDGRTAGARAVVWIVDSSVKGLEQGGADGRLEADPMLTIARDPASYLEMLQVAPFLSWRITDGGKLDWANDAYVQALDGKSVERAVASNLLIDAASNEQARRVIDTQEAVEEVRHVTIAGGKRAAFRVLMFPVSGGAGGMAFDITETERLREDFKDHVAAHDETLNHLAEGIAVFGPDKRLVFHNKAFAKMWGLDGAFLAEGPSHAQWLDELKAKRMLPFTAISRNGARASSRSIRRCRTCRKRAGTSRMVACCASRASVIPWAGSCSFSPTSPASRRCAANTTISKRSSRPRSTSCMRASPCSAPTAACALPMRRSSPCGASTPRISRRASISRP